MVFLVNVTLEADDQWNATLNFTHPGDSDRARKLVARFHAAIAACLALSLLCLIAVLVIYNLISEFKNIHGKILLSLSGCLAVTYSFLVIDLIFRKMLPPEVCYSVGMVVHVSFLATFFWTNVMAYDAWRTISGMKPRPATPQRGRYLAYATYAWGATLLVSLPALIFDHTQLLPLGYRPNIGIKRCWLSGTKAFLLYFNSPVGVVLLTNLVFFLLTVKTLVRFRKATAILNVRKDKKRFYLYIKLFLIMGLVWITEYIPWITGQYKLYAIAGVLNSLHGLYLFLIFVCKKSVFRSLSRLRAGRLDSSSTQSRKISIPTTETSFKSNGSVFYRSSSPNINDKTSVAIP